MARVDIDPITVLTTVETALQNGLNISPDLCYLSLDPDENYPAPGPGDRIIIIEPEGANFSENLFWGGGPRQVTIETAVNLQIYSGVRVDPNAKKQRLALIDSARGIFQLMIAIMDTLVGVDLTAGGNTFLRELMRPIGFSQPAKIDNNLLHSSMSWAISYDWLNTQ
ncbi:MAG: hypothetical protein ACREQ5_05625 [Candidatus Dormibacteria bacterium]